MKKYNNDVFIGALSPAFEPAEDTKKRVLSFLNHEISFTDLGPYEQFVATATMDKMNRPPKEEDTRKEMTTEQYNEFCRNVGIDPDTGRSHTNTQDAIQEEKYERRF